MKELDSLDSPSFADKEEYDNLVKTNRELQRKIDLLKLEEDTKNQETRKAFVETMEKDTDGQWDKDDEYFYYGNPFNINPQNLGEGNPWPYIVATSFLPLYPGSIQTQAVPEDELISVYKGYQTELEELNEEYANDLGNRTYTKKKEKLEKKIKEISSYLQKKSSQWESDSSDIEYVKNPAPDSEDEAVNKWLDYIADFQDRVAIAMGAENAKVNAFNRLIDNWQFDDTVHELEDLGKEGKVTAEMLDNDNYKGFIDKLVFLGVIDSADNLNDIALAFNNLAAAVKNADEAPTSFSDIFSLKSADDTLTNLGKLSESIDTIQNAYKTLNDAIDEYSQNGVFSIDTLQSVTALGDDWLDYLVDEKGNLTLDKEALERLTCARLNDMRVQAINNVIDNVSKIKDDAKANEYLASTNYALADSYEAVAKAELDNAKASMAEAVKTGDLSQDNMDEALKKAAADIDKINKLFDNTNIAEDSIMGGSSSGLGSATSEFSETIDFFERRITVLDNALSHLKSTMDNVAGSFGKNNLLDTELSITEEKFNNYSDALSMYTQKANEAFAKIPADIASKVKDGAVALNDFIGDGNQDVVEAIKDYESWAGKVSDCQQNLAELKKEIRQLELEKFNNIISDFSNQFDLRENSKDLISKLIDLLKESGELIGESFYAAQLEQSRKQLKLLEDEKTQLVDRMTSAVGSWKIQKGTDEWLEMINALSDVDGKILDCKKSIEEFDNAILELHAEVFNRIQSAFGNISDEISNLIGLMEDSDVGSSDGSWTKEGLTQLGLYAQQYELAKYQVSQYAGEIEKLNADYLNGRYSAAEYADKLADLSSAQWDAVNAAESAKDAIIDLNKARVDIAVDAIQEQIDAYKELTDAQIKALQAEKDLHDYEKSLAEKEKNIAKLRKQIAAMQNDKNAATVAKRKQLEEQLAEALADLEETQYQHSIEAQEEALNQQYEDYEELRNKEIEALEDSLKDEEKLISDSLNAVKRNTETISNQIVQIARDHGISVSNEIVNAWKSGENAIASYGEVLTAGTSAFIGQIQSVEAQIYQLQSDADAAAVTFANLFATKADNLINELAESYYAEANLYNMTQALQNSLTATLEGGYDVSRIVNSLGDIEDAAQKALEALNRLKAQESGENNIPSDLFTDDVGVHVGESLNKIKENYPCYRLIDKMTGKVWRDGLTHNEAAELYKDKNVAIHTTMEKYASGTRNAKGGLRIENEKGYELVLPKLSAGNYAIGNAGDQILTKSETDTLFEWAKLHPIDIVPDSIKNLADNLKINIPIPEPVKNLYSNGPTFHYDSLVTINGDVNDTDHFIKQMAKVADQQINKSWKKFNDEFKY